VLSAEDLEGYIHFARSYEEARGSVDNNATISPTASTFSSLDFGGDATSSASSYTPDPHAVSRAEAQSYYAGLHSEPTLLYRTGKEQWSAPRGPEAGAMRSLYSSNYKGLEPRLGLEIYGRSHG